MSPEEGATEGPSEALTKRGGFGSDMLDGLDPDQLVRAVALPLPPGARKTSVTVLLWTVRITLIALTGLVVFVFLHSL